MRIRVVDTVDQFVRHMDEAATNQVPFALARALTKTAQDAQSDVRSELPKRFTIRRTFVSQSIRITPARKGTPVAVVGATSRVPFMARQETGGRKSGTKGHRVAIPVKVKRSKRDLIPKGQLPSAVRAKPRVFLITSSAGAGIVQREGKDRYPLKILYWLRQGVTVKPRFGFKRTTGDTVTRAFGTNFIASLSEAMGHRG